MNFIERVNAALQDGLSKQIFDHVRNYLICAMLLAVGVTEIREHDSMLFGLVSSKYSGYGVVAAAVVLMLFNLYDGARKISGVRYHLLLTLGIVVLYLFLSIRVVEMTLNYRIARTSDVTPTTEPVPGVRGQRDSPVQLRLLQRLNFTPAATRSQVRFVTPASRSANF